MSKLFVSKLCVRRSCVVEQNIHDKNSINKKVLLYTIRLGDILYTSRRADVADLLELALLLVARVSGRLPRGNP